MEIMDKVNEIANKVSKKAGEAAEIARLTGRIHSEMGEMDDVKKKIGEVYFKRYMAGTALDPETEALCREIEKHKRSIAENKRLRKRLTDTDPHGQTAPAVCPFCGETLTRNAKFCAACGKEVR